MCLYSWIRTKRVNRIGDRSKSIPEINRDRKMKKLKNRAEKWNQFRIETENDSYEIIDR